MNNLKISNNSKVHPRIYLSSPHMSDEGYEMEFVREAFATNWIAPIGPQIDAFEKELALYNNTAYSAAVSSGTSAIHLALIILGVGQGDEVFCSSFTFSASANPIIYQGAKPVFIDSDTKSWNLDPGLLEEELHCRNKVGKLPKAVIVVDLYGQSADWEPIQELCNQYSIPLIEDSAEALGAEYKGKKTGNFGLAGVFSFNGNKTITTSGGGMLVSANESIVNKARFLATQARDSAPHYQHSEIGYNYRMSNVLAAIGRGQLKTIEQKIEKKRWIFEYFRSALKHLPGIDFMPEADYGKSNHWLTCITVDPKLFGASREEIRLKLEEFNIESRPLWKPMHLQPVFEGCQICGGSVSERLFEIGLCLPSGTAMTDEDLNLICEVIHSTHKR